MMQETEDERIPRWSNKINLEKERSWTISCRVEECQGLGLERGSGNCYIAVTIIQDLGPVPFLFESASVD